MAEDLRPDPDLAVELEEFGLEKFVRTHRDELFHRTLNLNVLAMVTRTDPNQLDFIVSPN